MGLPIQYTNAVKRQGIKALMGSHNYTRREARAAWSHVNEQVLTDHSAKCGVMVGAFNMSSIVQWLKDNWKTVLQVALSIVGFILMFADRPPTATNIPKFDMSGQVSVRTELDKETIDVLFPDGP